MYDNFLVAVGAVVPLFVLMGLGVFIKAMRLLTEEELKHVNRMVFDVFFFCMMFYNMYTTELAKTFRPQLMIFGAVGVLAVFVLAMIIVPQFEKENKRRGAMVQAIFRSNFVLIGIPLVDNIFGAEAIAIPTMMIAIIVPIYNVLAVLCLETFRGGKFSLPKILLGVFKNPMILGALCGLILLLLNIPVPEPVLKPIRQVAAATTPVALIILGASIKRGSFHAHLRQLVTCVTARLIVVPGIMIALAIHLGFRGIDLVTIMSVFAPPCAVAGFAMAQQMNSDADLAGNCVVYTSALSCFTIFGWVLLLKSFGFF